MAQCPPGTFSYAVRPGDNFWRLARRFNTSPWAIARANPMANSWSLRVGQPLCIPGWPPPAPRRCPPGWERYQIQPGDTLGEIAFERETSVWNLMRVNGISNPRNLRVGQIVCVPS